MTEARKIPIRALAKIAVRVAQSTFYLILAVDESRDPLDEMIELKADFTAKLSGYTSGQRFGVLGDPFLSNDTPHRIFVSAVQNIWMKDGDWPYMCLDGTGLLELVEPVLQTAVNNGPSSSALASVHTAVRPPVHRKTPKVCYVHVVVAC